MDDANKGSFDKVTWGTMDRLESDTRTINDLTDKEWEELMHRGEREDYVHARQPHNLCPFRHVLATEHGSNVHKYFCYTRLVLSRMICTNLEIIQYVSLRKSPISTTQAHQRFSLLILTCRKYVRSCVRVRLPFRVTDLRQAEKAVTSTCQVS
jgi:hypothetical protein